MGYRPGKEPEKPGEEWGKARTPEKKKTLSGVFAVFISGVLILYGAVRLTIYTVELSNSRNTSRELQMIQAEEHEDTGENSRDAEAGISAENPEMTAAEARTDGSHQNPSSSEHDPDKPPSETVSPGMSAKETNNTASVQVSGPQTPDPSRPAGNLSAEAQPAAEAEASEFLPAMPYTDKPYLSISERFIRLRKKGQYIIGWLSMDQVEEAVVQKDNDFFLDHDATGRKNSNGAIFLDQSVNLRTRPYTLILYGHNMKSGNMFGHLKKYRDSSYFYGHRMISFDSMYEEGKYAVFAVMEMSTTPGTSAWYNLWSLNSNRRTDREDAIEKLERKSLIGCSLDVRPDDQLLVLVTCLDGEDERLVVAARRLREGESENNLTIRQ